MKVTKKKKNKKAKRSPIKLLGEKIRKVRKNRKLTQDELTKKNKDLNISSLSKIENSHVQDPSISMVKAIADALDIGIDELIKQ